VVCPAKAPANKASGDAPKKDDKTTIDPKLDKGTINGKPIVREIVPIEILGGKRFPTDGKDRYYLLKKNEPPVNLAELEDYFQQQHAKLELKIIHTDESTFINTDMDPTRRLQKLASKYDIPSRVHGP
jgi:hypothetical protein